MYIHCGGVRVLWVWLGVRVYLNLVCGRVYGVGDSVLLSTPLFLCLLGSLWLTFSSFSFSVIVLILTWGRGVLFWCRVSRILQLLS